MLMIFEESMKTLHVADTITEVFNLFKRCNKYIDETEPWVLGKDESKYGRLSEVLYNLVESISIGANLLAPFMPETAERIFVQLYPDAPETGKRNFDVLDKFGLFPDGGKVTDKPEILFARMDAKELEERVAQIEEKQKESVAKAGVIKNGDN